MVLPDIYEQAGLTQKKTTPLPPATTGVGSPTSTGTVPINPSVSTVGTVPPPTAPASTTAAPVNTGSIAGITAASAGVTGVTPMTGAAVADRNQYIAPMQPQTNVTDKTDLTQKDAFAVIADQLRQWGLEGLSDNYVSLMTSGMDAQSALNKVKYSTEINPATGKAWNDAYATRFAGNAARVAKGLNAMSEGAYLAAETSYANTLKQYGLGNMLSTDRAANQKMFSTYIANDIDQVEFADRIKTAENNVINADPQVLNAFKTYYGGLTTSDLVSYFLSPDQTLPKLQQKALAAQIGGAGAAQGLALDSEARAMQLANAGVTQAGAQQGFQNVAAVLPTASKLQDIYGTSNIKYGQQEAEDEFLLNNEAAAKKRKGLASLERAQFQGDSGTNAASLGNQSLTRNVQGKF